MLDPLPIGEEPKNLVLKCNLCGMSFDADDPDDIEDTKNIDETGRCLICYEEYGDLYPDQV